MVSFNYHQNCLSYSYKVVICDKVIFCCRTSRKYTPVFLCELIHYKIVEQHLENWRNLDYRGTMVWSCLNRASPEPHAPWQDPGPSDWPPEQSQEDAEGRPPSEPPTPSPAPSELSTPLPAPPEPSSDEPPSADETKQQIPRTVNESDWPEDTLCVLVNLVSTADSILKEMERPLLLLREIGNEITYAEKETLIYLCDRLFKFWSWLRNM